MLEGPASHYFAAPNLKIRSLLAALNANHLSAQDSNQNPAARRRRACRKPGALLIRPRHSLAILFAVLIDG